MRVDYRQLERDIPKIAAQIEKVSGLKVPLETLNFEVDTDYYGRQETAIYKVEKEKIVIFKENIPSLSFQNSLNLIAGHELMHHAQFSIECFYALYERMRSRDSVKGNYDYEFISVQRMMEGDATWVQEKLEQYYPLDFLSSISLNKLNMRFAGVTRHINSLADRYGMGKRIIDSLVASGGREKVNCLYSTELDEIHRNFNSLAVERQITAGETQFNNGMITLGETIEYIDDLLEESAGKIEDLKETIKDKKGDLLSTRAKRWLESMAKKDPKIADFKRIYDEITRSKKK